MNISPILAPRKNILHTLGVVLWGFVLICELPGYTGYTGYTGVPRLDCGHETLRYRQTFHASRRQYLVQCVVEFVFCL